jgi:hypothetical protein
VPPNFLIHEQCRQASSSSGCQWARRCPSMFTCPRTDHAHCALRLLLRCDGQLPSSSSSSSSMLCMLDAPVGAALLQ